MVLRRRLISRALSRRVSTLRIVLAVHHQEVSTLDESRRDAIRDIGTVLVRTDFELVSMLHFFLSIEHTVSD